MNNFVTAALAWFNRLAPLPKLAVVVVILFSLAVLLSPSGDDAAYGEPVESPIMQLAETLFLLSIPITLLGAFYMFRTSVSWNDLANLEKNESSGQHDDMMDDTPPNP